MKNFEEFLLQELKKEWEEIELASKKEDLKKKSKEAAAIVAKTLLMITALAGVMAVATVAPNIFVAFGRSGDGRRYRWYFEKDTFKKAKRDLQRGGYIVSYFFFCVNFTGICR